MSNEIDDLGLGGRFAFCGFRAGVTDFLAALRRLRIPIARPDGPA